MRRRTVRILVCVVLGAVVNVAVAWGCALFVTLDDQSRTAHDVFNDWEGTTAFPSYTAHRWSRSSAHRVEVYKGGYEGQPWPNTATFEELIPNWGAEFLHIPELDGTVDNGRFDEEAWGDRAVDARGWPCLALWGGIRPSFDGSQWLVQGSIPIEVTPPYSGRSYSSMRWLPLLPVWPGFLANTVLYAIAACVLFFFTPSRIRRSLRHRRGRCPSCGYDLRGDLDTGCPECGWGREAGAES